MMTEPTSFQTQCIARLNRVLQGYGKEVTFTYETDGDVPGFFGELRHEGRSYSLEVYPDTVVMYEGDRIFEAYLAEEVRSDKSLIEGFSRRLDRLLSGGPWQGPDERSWIDKLLDAIFGPTRGS